MYVLVELICQAQPAIFCIFSTNMTSVEFSMQFQLVINYEMIDVSVLDKNLGGWKQAIIVALECLECF